MKPILFSNSGRINDFGLLILRVFAGFSMAFAHGLGKLPVSAKFIGGVENLGLPAPELFAWAAALSEFLGGILVAMGLLTRPSALFLTITMLVAAFGTHLADPFGRKEKALLFAVAFVFVMLQGGGKYSLDHLLFKKK